MTDKSYAFYTENFEIYQFHYKTYGHGVWYNPSEETYSQAIERAKKELYAKVQEDNPHLIMFGEEKKREYGTPLVSLQDVFNNPREEIIKEEDAYIDAIVNSASLQWLKLYKNKAEKYPRVKEAYDKKLQELQKQTA